MKTLALLLFLGGVIIARADDNLLQNGDFSGGVAHWYGNVQTPGDLDDATLPDSGVVIKLRPHDWTRANQDFQVKAGTYNLNIVFTLISGFHFSDQYSDYINLPKVLDFPAGDHPVDGSIGQWVAIIADNVASSSLYWTGDPPQSAGQQTYTFKVKDINFDNRQNLSLNFPPGSGYVVLQKVALVASP
jgi:hypothetical protein